MVCSRHEQEITRTRVRNRGGSRCTTSDHPEQGGRGDLTPSQVSVLLRLEKDGAATVSGLARAEGMRPQSMSSIVASLEDAGLVSGIPDPNDGRKTLMS